MQMQSKNCGACHWYGKCHKICVNDISPYCGEMMSPVDTCDFWECIGIASVEYSPQECGYEK